MKNSSTYWELKQIIQIKTFLSLRENMCLIFCVKQEHLNAPTSVSIEQNYDMSYEEESVKFNKGWYPRLVGNLIYLAHIRPNFAYAISLVSQLMHDPRVRHLQKVDHILQYLKVTPKSWLLFKKSGSLTIEVTLVLIMQVHWLVEDLLQTIVFTCVKIVLLGRVRDKV